MDLDEDANIWRLVSRDTEKTQVNYGGGGGGTSDFTQSSGSQYQGSSQKRHRYLPRKMHLLGLLVALLMLVTVFEVVYQLKSRHHKSSHQSQVSQGYTQQQFDDKLGYSENGATGSPIYGSSFRGSSIPGATEIASVNEIDFSDLPVISEEAEPENDSSGDQNLPTEEPKLLLDQYVPIVTTSATIHDLTGYKPTWAPASPTDVPVFFNLAYQLTGARIFKDILGICHHLTIATEDVRSMLPNLSQDEIQVLNIEDPEKERLSLATVDTTILSELVRAERLGLAKLGLVDFIMVRHLYEANKLFDQDHQGRIFGVFRDPVQAAWGAFLVVEYTHPHLKNMTFAEFADSNIAEDNWMVRALSNQPMDVELTREHLKIAIEFVRDKMLVGLISHRDETLGRFEEFFGWKYKEDPQRQEHCRQDFLDGLGNEKHRRIAPEKNIPAPKVEAPKAGEEIYEKLASKNHFDMSLYKHIEELFVLQSSLVSSTSDNFRLEGASCCLCDRSC